MKALARITPVKATPNEMPCLRTDDRAYVRMGFYVLLVTFVLLLGWSALAPLQSAVVANGRLVAASQNKIVQHLDGGLVERILVADGHLVEAGQPLLRLDANPLQIKLSNIGRQLFELHSNLERLSAERSGHTEVKFSAGLHNRAESEFDREILDTQHALFHSRRQAVSSEREMLELRSTQASSQIEGLSRMIQSWKQRAYLLEKDLAGLEILSAGKLVSATKVRELQRKRFELSGDIAEREGEVARLKESVAENRQQMVLRQKEYQGEVVTSMRDLQAQLIVLDANRRAVLDKLSRIEIAAPSSGKIKGFNIVTAGAVIRAGEAIMEIVSVETSYRIHARVSPMDVDALHPGMQAEVRMPTFDGSRNFPVIYADLEDVSADAYTNEAEDISYYKATLALERDGLGVLADEGAQLIPGMPVEVFLRTGERTFFDYLTRPLQDLVARALNEA